jgi:Na+/H+ antiporter NhaD/arsenite permease-like protein
LSAFLVNDIVCLTMTPFVLHMARRLQLAPVPYLIAVATASNIGSVVTNH